MAEKTDIEAEASAEKAYAAAAEAVAPKAIPLTATPSVGEPVPEVEFPSKAKRVSKPAVAAPATDTPVAPAKPAPVTVPFADVAPVVPAAEAAPLVDTKPTQAALLKAGSALANTPAVEVEPVVAPVAAKPTPAPPVATKAASKKVVLAKQAVKPKAIAPKAVEKPKPSVATKATAPKIAAQKTLFQQLKDKTMDTTEFTTKIKTAVSEAQAKAKEAFDKGAATFTEYNEFSKGNVEAVVASGKILASGLQSLGKIYVEDGKTAFGALTAEVKELAKVKSPTDFVKLQTELLRRNFDSVVAYGSKNSEAVLKLASEVAAPISARVNLAVEKVKKAA